MNLYLRFFDDEILVENYEQAEAFIMQVCPDLNSSILDELKAYVESNNNFTKRFKVSARSYFIAIKTTANTMEEFRAYATEHANEPQESEKEVLQRALNAERPGWYQVELTFRRVVQDAVTGKAQYVDTEFAAKLKAISIQDSYNRVIDHLRNRQDIDSRSQYPSIKGKKFQSTFIEE